MSRNLPYHFPNRLMSLTMTVAHEYSCVLSACLPGVGNKRANASVATTCSRARSDGHQFERLSELDQRGDGYLDEGAPDDRPALHRLRASRHPPDPVRRRVRR